MIPIQTILYPFFKVIHDFKLTDQYIGLIVTYVVFGIPITTYQLAAYFKRIPNELIESARIDGASTIKIIFRIIFPTSKPVVVTVTLINFIWMWNELLLPLMVLQTPKMQTLTVSLTIIRGQWGVTPPLLSAGIIIGILPVAVMYFFAQNQIVKGMTYGAVKG
jgi:ABC-type glycerol-3-phosphate transport system permease component